MLEEVRVFQQPSGFVDSVIMTWIMEAEAEEIPVSIHQRDLFAAALSEEARRAAWLSHQHQVHCKVNMTTMINQCHEQQVF